MLTLFAPVSHTKSSKQLMVYAPLDFGLFLLHTSCEVKKKVNRGVFNPSRYIYSHDIFRQTQQSQSAIGFKSVYNPDLKEEIGLDNDDEDPHSYAHKSTDDMVDLYKRTTSLRARIDILHMLLSR